VNNIIVVAELVNPPSETFAFRSLTLCLKVFCQKNILLEVEQEQKDIYYSYIKRFGAHDYLDQMVTPEEFEYGVRIDYEFRFAPSIVVDRITLNNYREICGNCLM